MLTFSNKWCDSKNGAQQLKLCGTRWRWEQNLEYSNGGGGGAEGGRGDHLSLTEPLQCTVADRIQRDDWHGSVSYQHRRIWRTALNFLAAQTPQCERCKRQRAEPSCLLYEDKTCIFRTLLVLWKGHWLVWNIKQLSLSEIKKDFGRVESFTKGFDGIYIAQSRADMTEWRNKDVGTKRLWEREGGRGYSSLWILHGIIPQSERLALKMSGLVTEKRLILPAR